MAKITPKQKEYLRKLSQFKGEQYVKKFRGLLIDGYSIDNARRKLGD